MLAEYSDSECCFVKVGKREGCSIAQEGDILVVVVDDDPLLGDWIILKHGRNRHILQYLKKSLTEDVVWLRSSIYSFELDYQTFRRYVEIVGIIKSKISISTKIQETIPDYLRK